jgi:hypothetical protein
VRDLQQVRIQLSEGGFEFSRHALRRVVERNISGQEIRQAGLRAMIIEEYPADKYSPSCLLLGFTDAGRPLHVQVSMTRNRPVKIVTLYEPNLEDCSGYSEMR